MSSDECIIREDILETYINSFIEEGFGKSREGNI